MSKDKSISTCQGCGFTDTPRAVAGHKRYCFPYKHWKAQQPARPRKRRGGSRRVHTQPMTLVHVYLDSETLNAVHAQLPTPPGRGALTRLLRSAISAETVESFVNGVSVPQSGSFHTTILLRSDLVALAARLHPLTTITQVASQLVRLRFVVSSE